MKFAVLKKDVFISWGDEFLTVKCIRFFMNRVSPSLLIVDV